MTEPEHVVFDCNVYFQSLISPTGPAGTLLLAVQEGRLILYASQRVFTELLSLQDTTTPEGKSFHERFPDIEILTPVGLLDRLRSAES